MADDLINLIANLHEEQALEAVRKMLDASQDPLIILEDSRKALELVGKRFAEGDYFIPELLYSGEIAKEIAELVKPKLVKAQDGQQLGKVIIGTVAGDIHDLGKNIVTFMLEVSGFQVYDIGIDQPSQSFIDTIKQTGAGIVGLSGFLTLAFDSMKDTVEAISSAGLRDSVKIMIGGGLVNDDIRRYTGADAYGKDAMAGVELAKKWTVLH
jgi:methanogenic corrinoid protein MtbC1